MPGAPGLRRRAGRPARPPAFLVELVADGCDPAEGPAAARLKRWLKTARRTHGLTCRGAQPVPVPPTAHLAATTHPDGWRPCGRRIRRATAAPLGHVRPPEVSRAAQSPDRPADAGPDPIGGRP